MSAFDYVSRVVYPAAMKMLPLKMDSLAAKAMILSTGAQESAFIERKQIGGPARGFWEFEEGGAVIGVLGHRDTKYVIEPILVAMAVQTWHVYDALTDNDILACIMARLLLWTHPDPLPGPNDPTTGWRQYQDMWRPGKPRPETWAANYQRAWKEVSA